MKHKPFQARWPHLVATSWMVATLLSGCATSDVNLNVPIEDRSAYSVDVQQPTRPLQQPGSVTDSGRTHTMAPGDTIYNVAVRYGTEVDQLMQLNGITDPTQIRLGQVLRIPASSKEGRDVSVGDNVRVNALGGDGVTQENTTTHTDADGVQTNALPMDDVSKPVEQGATAPTITNTPIEQNQETKADQSQQQAQASKPSQGAVVPGTRLLWPVRGKILSDFAKNGKGIDIASPAGSVVVAAAPGEVIFVGDGVKGYGNLVIIRHANGLVTAYGHNSKITVKLHTQVRAGQKIAEVGQTDADQPMLRFEVRDKGKPVDPQQHLGPMN